MQPPPVAAPPGPTLLAAITADLAAGSGLRELLDRFLEPLVQLAAASAGAVRVLSPDGERFELVCSIGLPASVQEAERIVARQCGFCGRSASGPHVTWAQGPGDCPLRGEGDFFTRDCRRALAVPMQHKGRVLGIYNLFFEGPGGEPPPAVVALLRSVGELLGLALQNHRLEAENLRATIDRERQEMAAEVHDAVAQNLTYIKMRLPLLRDAIEAHDPRRALAFLDDVRETVGEAHGNVREIVTHFRTSVDPRGIAPALEALAERLRAHARVDVRLDNRAPQLRLPAATQAELFHIVQEALANVEHHAAARHCWLALDLALDRIEIRVDDDGVGPGSQPADDGVAHYGVQIMQERARRLGGHLTVGPRAGGGTTVRCTLPLPGEESR